MLTIYLILWAVVGIALCLYFWHLKFDITTSNLFLIIFYGTWLGPCVIIVELIFKGIHDTNSKVLIKRRKP